MVGKVQRKENKMVLEMIARINAQIAIAETYYEINGENDQRTMDKISGMVEMLSMVTGKGYIVTENGLVEK